MNKFNKIYEEVMCEANPKLYDYKYEDVRDIIKAAYSNKEKQASVIKRILSDKNIDKLDLTDKDIKELVKVIYDVNDKAITVRIKEGYYGYRGPKLKDDEPDFNYGYMSMDEMGDLVDGLSKNSKVAFKFNDEDFTRYGVVTSRNPMPSYLELKVDGKKMIISTDQLSWIEEE